MKFSEKMYMLVCDKELIHDTCIYNREFFDTLTHITLCIENVIDLTTKPSWLINAYKVLFVNNMLSKINFTVDTIPKLLDSHYLKIKCIFEDNQLIPTGDLCMFIYVFLNGIDESYHLKIFNRLSNVLIYEINGRYNDPMDIFVKHKIRFLYSHNPVFKSFLESHQRYVNKLKLTDPHNSFHRFDYMELLDIE